MNPLIFNIQHFSYYDGPGIRTVIFFKGCPLNCIWCHNPEGKAFYPELSFDERRCVLCGNCVNACMQDSHHINGTHELNRSKCILCGKCQEVCPKGALEIIGKYYTMKELFSEIEKDASFLGNNGGITISGGEPFAQFDALIELLKACKKKGYHTCIETSGYTTSDKLLCAAKYTDIFLYDCKETRESRHLEYTGVGMKQILSNLSSLDKFGSHVVLRCPIIHEINDNEEHIKAVAKIAEAHKAVKSIELEMYHPLGISKGKCIGKIPKYTSNEFFDKKRGNLLLELLKEHTTKPVSIH